jgi:glycosyltransferase involved in cell wall biosynthesis
MNSVYTLFSGHPQTDTVTGKPFFGAVEIYRGTQPLMHLEQHGWTVGFDYMETLSAKLYQMYPDWPEMGMARIFRQAEIIVLSRIAFDSKVIHMAKAFVEAGRRFGCHFIYETDDDYTNEHRQAVSGDAMSVASLCDAITVTTPYLGETMRRRTGRPYYVLPNQLNPVWWKGERPPRKVSDDTVIISLSGTPTHMRDWEVLKEVLPALLKKHAHARLVMAGCHPEYLQGIEQVEYLPAMNYLQYVNFIRQCDIVLAPVDPTDGFNMGKSPIKALEGNAGGAAVIATDNPIYRLAVEPDKSGILVEHTPDAWYAALDKLLTDANYRKQLAKQGNAHVWKHYNIQKGWKKWERAYREVISLPQLAEGVLQ